MKMSFPRAALSLLGAALLLCASVGFASAQSNAPAKQAVIDDAAAKLGLTGDQLRDALKQARKELGTRVRVVVKDELTVAAKAIGLADAKALRKELAGSTLTAVAQKHNVAPATVSNAIKADIDTKIDALVSSGKLKADRAAALKTKAHARVDALMTRQFKAKAAAS